MPEVAIDRDMSERMIRVETKLDVMLEQLAAAQPKIDYLSRETERQKDSLARAHDRLDAQEQRYYWLVGSLITIALAVLTLMR